MQKKNVVRIILDIAMIVIFILLYNTTATGLLFHEVVGLVIVGIVAIHLLINKKWIEAIGSFFRNKEKHKKQLFRLGLNIALLAGTVIVTVTGIMISMYVFPALNIATDGLITLHKWSSYIMGGALALHTVLHWRFIVHMARRLFAEGRAAALKTAMVGVGAVALAMFVVYNNVLSLMGSGGKDYVLEVATVPAGSAVSGSSKENGEEELLPLLPQETYYGAGAGAGAALPGESTEDSVNLPEAAAESGEYITPNAKNSASEQTYSADEPVAEQITLQEFLRNMFCTACPKNCSLAAPQCGKSRPEIQQATAEYEATYGVSQ